MMLLKNIRKIKTENILRVIKFVFALIPSLLLKATKQNIQLCFERIDVADDNAWMYFHWVRKHYPKENIYFVLDKGAHNFQKNDSHFIAWGSFRHHIYYLASNIYIMATFDTPYEGRISTFVNNLFRRKITKIYLRHGICKDGMELHRYEIHNFRLFFCGAKPEYDYVKIAGGYPEQNVKYTGFARFDDLLENKSDDHFILIIPTWRRYVGHDESKTREENEKIFAESEYCKNYNELINDSAFSKFLEDNNLKARFCLHAKNKKFEKYFRSDCPNIDIVNNDESIHKLIMTTSLLITDYSSVFFDAAYADKPVIYYHFDYDEFRKKHLKEGYFSYEKDGMGPIAHNISELIALINDSLDNGTFKRKDEYIARANRFFQLHDTQNCQRIYNEIKNVVNERKDYLSS